MSNIIFFWGREDLLSNFYSITYTDSYGHILCCSEQGYMYEKAIYFEDLELANKILLLKNPKHIKDAGQLVKNFDKDEWVKVKEDKMYFVLSSKFNVPEMRKLLLSTGDSLLAESSPSDKEWGIGFGKWQKESYNPNLWTGKNKLGKVLMKLREDMKKTWTMNTLDVSTVES